jgi:glycosyltransferase involved in cell wall biosynthesis
MNWKEYSFGSRVYFWFEKIMSFLADKIIYNSFAGKTYHENYGYCKKNGIVIWNGFDTTKMLRLYKEFDPLKLKAELGLVPNKKIISIIARVDNMKDHFTALKAIKKLLDNNIKDFVLLVIGDGNVELKEKLNNYVDKNQMNDYVLFLGMKNDIIPYYKITDILLSSSCFGEGVSNSIVEAMLFEKIIIATDVGDNSILINKERGYLFNVKDYNKLYEILKSLIKDDSNLNKDCLKKYVLENLNLNFMVNRYISEWSIK